MNGPPTGVPGASWIDAASRVIVQVGFPVVVAGVLLWFILGRFTSDMNGIAGRMESNARAIEVFVAVQNNQLEEMKKHTAALEEQTRLMKEFVMQRRYGKEPQP